MRRHCSAGLLALAALAAAACGDLKEVFSLQRGLAHEFNTQAISVNMNTYNGNTTITVLFQNSPVAQAPDSEQAALARRVGEYVRDHYSRYAQLQSIDVGFSSVKGGGFVRMTQTRVPFRFTPRDLGEPVTVTKAIPGDKH